MNKLSIIIPCFNCAPTIRAAVESCYTQGFPPAEFEIVLVNDYSTDDTQTVLLQLKSEYPNITLWHHEKNLGGGAARNTAADHATADVLFCLDSDDILPPNTLNKMYNHLTQKHCDGVGIHQSIKFVGTDTTHIDIIHTFNQVNERIQLEDLLQRSGLCSLYSTFMITKDAFQKIGGYPTAHGCDTQGIAWRFLAAGLYAESCPDATYLHRVQFKESYYLREYNDGKLNYNWQSILFEHIYLFTNETQEFIRSFNCKDFTLSLYGELQKRRQVFSLTRNDYHQTLPAVGILHAVSRNSPLGLFYRVRSRLRTAIIQNRHLKSVYLTGLFFYQDITSRLKDRGSLLLIGNYLLLRCKKIIWYRFHTSAVETNERIDIVIPTIGKDFYLLHAYIDSIRKNLRHTIGTMYIVAPGGDSRLLTFCQEQQIVFIDETTVLGYGKEKISYTFGSLNRAGWLFQQLLKLSGDKITSSKKYIIIDSDTLLMNAYTFIEDGKYIFYENTEWNAAYFSTFQKIFGYPAPHRLSLTSHMMIFDHDMLREMKAEIEAKHNMSWDEAYITFCDRQTPSGISDYETYGQWVSNTYPEKVQFWPFYNIALSRKTDTDNTALLDSVAQKTRTVSFHSYNG